MSWAGTVLSDPLGRVTFRGREEFIFSLDPGTTVVVFSGAVRPIMAQNGVLLCVVMGIPLSDTEFFSCGRIFSFLSTCRVLLSFPRMNRQLRHRRARRGFHLLWGYREVLAGVFCVFLSHLLRATFFFAGGPVGSH